MRRKISLVDMGALAIVGLFVAAGVVYNALIFISLLCLLRHR